MKERRKRERERMRFWVDFLLITCCLYKRIEDFSDWMKFLDLLATEMLDVNIKQDNNRLGISKRGGHICRG